MWLSDNFVKSGKYFAGIICRESASYVHHLTNYPPSPLLLYTDCDVRVGQGFIEPVFTPELNYADTELLSGRLFVTNKERTICEMINAESSDSYIFKALEMYLGTGGAEDLLRKYANSYLCEENLQYYLEQLDDYLNDL